MRTGAMRRYFRIAVTHCNGVGCGFNGRPHDDLVTRLTSANGLDWKITGWGILRSAIFMESHRRSDGDQGILADWKMRDAVMFCADGTVVFAGRQLDGAYFLLVKCRHCR